MVSAWARFVASRGDKRGTCWSSRTYPRSGRQNLKIAEPLSEVGKNARPWLRFSKTRRKEDKDNNIIQHACFGGFGLKAATP